MKQGWPSRTLYLVQSGVVLLWQDGVVIDTVTAGDIFGGDALLLLPADEDLQRVPYPVHFAVCLAWSKLVGKTRF